MSTIAISFIIIGYLIGSISTAVIVSKLFGTPDPRTSGSGNPGATNVLRTGGKKAAIIVLLADSLKGFVPVIIASLLGAPIFELTFVALATVLGHLYPIFFGFKGGKGVATSMGAMLALHWPLGLACLITWSIFAIVFNYASLASVVAAAVLPFYAHQLGGMQFSWPLAIISAFIIWRHRANIGRLLAGRESKIGKANITESKEPNGIAG